MLRELGIHLEDVSSQNNELIEKVDEQVEQKCCFKLLKLTIFKTNLK